MKRKWIFADWKLPDDTDRSLIVELGFTDAVLGVGDDLDGRFRLKFSKTKIAAAADSLRALGVRIHLMTWARRQRTFIKEMCRAMVPLCNEIGTDTLMLDAERHWHKGQGISPADATQLVMSNLRELTCPVGVTGLSNLHPTVAPLLRACDYGLGQAYSIWKPGTADHWSHGNATEPGRQQAASWASWSSENKPLIMGLSNYWAARPARSGKPAVNAEASLAETLESAVKVGASEVAYWSLKWLRRKDATAEAARKITRAIPIDAAPIPADTSDSSAAAVQWLLVQLGYDLGTFGPKHDGVDGSFGTRSQRALDDFRASEGLEQGNIYGTKDLIALVNRFRRHRDG